MHGTALCLLSTKLVFNMIACNDAETEEISEVFRDAPPSHFSFKVYSFSLLSKNSVEKYESCVFQVGNYKWKLLLYPEGDPSKDVDDHLSLYLLLSNTSSLRPPGWEVNVTYRFFILDQIRDRYLTLGDVGGKVRRFHGVITKRGFSKLISLPTFTNPSNGYLVNDVCEFGVEVFVLENTCQSERLYMLDTASTCKYTWNVENFSQIQEERHDSEVFAVGGHKWKLGMYPKGSGDGKNTCLSLFLYLADPKPHPFDGKVYTQFTIRLKSRIPGEDVENKAYSWFKHTGSGIGWPEFIQLHNLRDTAQGGGYLVKDACVVQAEVTVLGSREKYP